MNLIPDPREHARIVAEMMQRAAELNGSAEIANIKMHREQLAVVVAALRQYTEATPPEALLSKPCATVRADETPRTDGIIADWAHWQEYRELARQLERECNALQIAYAARVEVSPLGSIK